MTGELENAASQATIDYKFVEGVHDLIARFDLSSKQRIALWEAIDPDNNLALLGRGEAGRHRSHPSNTARVERYRRAAEIALIVKGRKVNSPGDVVEHAKTLDDLIGDKRLANWQTIVKALSAHVRDETKAA